MIAYGGPTRASYLPEVNNKTVFQQHNSVDTRDLAYITHITTWSCSPSPSLLSACSYLDSLFPSCSSTIHLFQHRQRPHPSCLHSVPNDLTRSIASPAPTNHACPCNNTSAFTRLNRSIPWRTTLIQTRLCIPPAIMSSPKRRIETDVSHSFPDNATRVPGSANADLFCSYRS